MSIKYVVVVGVDSHLIQLEIKKELTNFRLFGIALALVNFQNKLVLVDRKSIVSNAKPEELRKKLRKYVKYIRDKLSNEKGKLVSNDYDFVLRV